MSPLVQLSFHTTDQSAMLILALDRSHYLQISLLSVLLDLSLGQGLLVHYLHLFLLWLSLRLNRQFLNVLFFESSLLLLKHRFMCLFFLKCFYGVLRPFQLSHDFVVTFSQSFLFLNLPEFQILLIWLLVRLVFIIQLKHIFVLSPQKFLCFALFDLKIVECLQLHQLLLLEKVWANCGHRVISIWNFDFFFWLKF